mmetsp:Transcript_94988/g.241443  ORF Transcript_94988/g.241443 Transcript_94988/m.241443 type:complete len:100 (+) Transcript_94988:89-388(+)
MALTKPMKSYETPTPDQEDQHILETLIAQQKEECPRIFQQSQTCFRKKVRTCDMALHLILSLLLASSPWFASASAASPVDCPAGAEACQDIFRKFIHEC